MLPQPYAVDFDETQSQYVNCYDLNVDYLTTMVNVVDNVAPGLIPITATQLNLMKPLGPQICVMLYNINMDQYDEALTFTSKVYLRAKNRPFGISVPEIEIPGLEEKAYKLGFSCHMLPQDQCLLHPLCGYCSGGGNDAAGGRCSLGAKDGPLCSVCPANRYQWRGEEASADHHHGGAGGGGGGTLLIISLVALVILLIGIGVWRYMKRNPEALNSAVSRWREDRYATMSEPDHVQLQSDMDHVPEYKDMEPMDGVPTATVIAVH